MSAAAARDRYAIVFGLFAAGNLLGGLWMLASPAGWFHGLPAGVPDFGPLNEHFVRDLGAMFLMMGVGLGWATFRPAVRLPVIVLVSLWYVVHALVHVYDTLRGLVGPEHWAIDLPAVYVPALVTAGLAVLVARRRPQPA